MGNEDDERNWEAMSTRCEKPTNCHFCGYLCAFIATVEDGRVIDLRPDPSRYPYKESIVTSCRRWRLNLDFLDSDTRINYPLKRQGERGSGEWERVSWDEAFDDIEKRLKELVDAHGPETLASAIGGPHASFWPLHRFMNLLGSPNNMGIGQICWNPRIWMDTISFGWTIEADINPKETEAIIIWGTNPAQSDNSAFWRSLLEYSKTEIPLIVIDPRMTQTARIADVWIPIRPGTDCSFALSLIQVIIEDGLIDQEFVEKWCHGYDELAEHVKPYTPENVSELCGISPHDIRKVAHLFGEAGASALISGRGIDQIGADVAPTHRAICCLRAITGNIDKPGSCVLTEMSDFAREVDLEMSDALSEQQQDRCLNTPYTPLQCYRGYKSVEQLTMKLGRRLPLRYMTSAHPDLVLRAMECAEPYPIRALIVEATNPLLTYADTHRVFDALWSLDLLVVLEYTMTPTASIADYVLPIAGAIERPVMQVHGGVANMAYGGPAAVAPYYERKTDYEVFRELGQRFGQSSQWPQESLTEAFAASLEPTGTTWNDFCRTGMYFRPPAYHKHEILNDEGVPFGFATTSGKIELASEVLTELGGQRLPRPARGLASKPAHTHEVSTSQRNTARESSGARSLTLLTGARKQPYNASVFMDIDAFNEIYPQPLVEMSATTAQSISVSDGDTLRVSTTKGSADFIVKIIEICDGVVSADYGWWYPKQNNGSPEYGGIWKSNINLLTDCSLEQAEPLIGTWSYNAIECEVSKIE